MTSHRSRHYHWYREYVRYFGLRSFYLLNLINWSYLFFIFQYILLDCLVIERAWSREGKIIWSKLKDDPNVYLHHCIHIRYLIIGQIIIYIIQNIPDQFPLDMSGTCYYVRNIQLWKKTNKHHKNHLKIVRTLSFERRFMAFDITLQAAGSTRHTWL